MSQFPNQKLTRKEIKKEYGSMEDWAKAIFNSISSIALVSSRNSYSNAYEKELLLDLKNGILNKQDFEYVTKPYGDNSPSYPAEFRHYDRISSKLHLLVGEEIKRPLGMKVVAVNSEAVTVAEEEKAKMLKQSLTQQLLQELKKAGIIGPEEEIEDPMTIPQIERYMGHDYQDIREIQANQTVEYLKEYTDLKEKFNTGWEWLLTTGDDIYYTGISYNEPNFRTVDPRYFDYDRSPHIKYIDEAQWAFEERWIPSARVYEEFGEFIGDEEVDIIEKIKGTFSQNIGYGSGAPVLYMSSQENFDQDSASFLEINTNSSVKVVTFCWKGLRKIGMLKYRDEDGSMQERIVGEDYKLDPEVDLDIEWSWINEVWEATKLGEDLFLGVRPRPNQYKSLDNPNKCRLPYTGISNPNLSIIKRVKEIQYLYDIIMYRMELAIARAKGKLMVMDTAQIPTSEGIDIDKWIYYADTSGFAFINSFEEGKGMFQGQRPNFNQFTQIDLTLSNTLQQYSGILDKLDFLIEDITGVSRQRQGQVSQYETAGGVERSVVQSSAITEHLFYEHSRVKRRVITNLIEECKLAWIDGKKTQYVQDDMTRHMLSIDGEIFNDAEYGIFVSDGSKHTAMKQTIEQLAQVAIQNQQASFKDIIGIIDTESVAEAKGILERSEEAAMQRAQESAQAEQKAIMEEKQLEAQEKQLDREMEKYKTDANNETKLLIAEIGSFKFQQDQDVNNNNVPDQLEIEKFRLSERDSVRKDGIEKEKLKQKDRELDIKDKQVSVNKANKSTAKK